MKIITIIPALLALNSLGGNGYCDPDSLVPVNRSGEARIITTGTPAQYFLDEDGDGVVDYRLNFGPHWYVPEGSGATRPAHGDYITVEGGLNTTSSSGLPMIIVYEINGLFWRNPYEPFWNHINGNFNGSNQQQGMGYNCGWLQDSLEWVTLQGVALTDTTFRHVRYYLDEDLDGLPDYRLNFGPPWYEPASGVSLPLPGESITVAGVLIGLPYLDMLIVAKLNGSVWRDSALLNEHMAGRWIRHNTGQADTVMTPFDFHSRMQIHALWNHGPLPDSLFCQLMEVLPQNMPQYEEQGAFACFEIGVFTGHGHNIMRQNKWQLTFSDDVEYRFHYYDQQLEQAGIKKEVEGNIRLKYWKPGQKWVEEQGFTIDTIANTIDFTSHELRGLYMLVSDVSTGNGDMPTADRAITGAAYPNPSSGGVYLPVYLDQPGTVQLVVYNALGKIVTRQQEQGFKGKPHSLYVDCATWPPGLYYFQLSMDGIPRDQQKVLVNSLSK